MSFENDVKLALWKNDKRTKPTQPLLKGGKPQVINGQEYWVSAWLNAPKGDDATAAKVERMVDALADLLGTYPIISVSLSPADGQAPAAGSSTFQAAAPEDDLPF
jgi:hypothetical protein